MSREAHVRFASVFVPQKDQILEAHGGQLDGELEEPVELSAIPSELRFCIEKIAECRLNGYDFRADTEPPADPGLEIGRRGEMVGVHMCFQPPLDRQSFVGHIVGDPVSGRMASAPRMWVIVEHRVDDRAGPRFYVDNDITHRISRFIKKGSDGRFQCRLNLRPDAPPSRSFADVPAEIGAANAAAASARA